MLRALRSLDGSVFRLACDVLSRGREMWYLHIVEPWIGRRWLVIALFLQILYTWHFLRCCKQVACSGWTMEVWRVDVWLLEAGDADSVDAKFVRLAGFSGEGVLGKSVLLYFWGCTSEMTVLTSREIKVSCRRLVHRSVPEDSVRRARAPLHFERIQAEFRTVSDCFFAIFVYKE